MKKTLSLFLILVLTLSMCVSISSAITNDSAVQITVEDYFKTKLSLLQLSTVDQVASLEALFSNGSIDKDYEVNRLKYHIQSNNISETTIEDFNTSFDFISININGSTADVTLDVSTEIKYSFLSNFDKNISRHELKLIKQNAEWLIVQDQYIDEFKKLFSSASELQRVIPNLRENHRSNVSQNILNKNQIPKQDDFSIQSIPGDSNHSYTSTMRSNAVTYARTYTDNTGGHESTYYNNSQFKYFSYQNDCQNFVSQAIWYGFGGRSSATKDFPMSAEWWADTSNTSTTWNWTGTSYFLNMVKTNYSNNRYGLQGYATTVSNIKSGDYVYVPGHVLFITKATDANGNGIIEYNELEIAAHTSNRKDKNLAALYGSTQPSNMQFIRIVQVKWNTDMQMY